MNKYLNKSFCKHGKFKVSRRMFKIYYVSIILKNKSQMMMILRKNVLKWLLMNLNKKMRKEMNNKCQNNNKNLKKKNINQNKNITINLIN